MLRVQARLPKGHSECLMTVTAPLDARRLDQRGGEAVRLKVSDFHCARYADLPEDFGLTITKTSSVVGARRAFHPYTEKNAAFLADLADTLVPDHDFEEHQQEPSVTYSSPLPGEKAGKLTIKLPVGTGLASDQRAFLDALLTEPKGVRKLTHLIKQRGQAFAVTNMTHTVQVITVPKTPDEWFGAHLSELYHVEAKYRYQRSDVAGETPAAYEEFLQPAVPADQTLAFSEVNCWFFGASKVSATSTKKTPFKSGFSAPSLKKLLEGMVADCLRTLGLREDALSVYLSPDRRLEIGASPNARVTLRLSMPKEQEKLFGLRGLGVKLLGGGRTGVVAGEPVREVADKLQKAELPKVPIAVLVSGDCSFPRTSSLSDMGPCNIGAVKLDSGEVVHAAEFEAPFPTSCLAVSLAALNNPRPRLTFEEDLILYLFLSTL